MNPAKKVMPVQNNTSKFQTSSDTLAGDEVRDLSRPAPVKAEAVVVPHDAPAAVPHAVDAQLALANTRERFTYKTSTQGGKGECHQKK